MHGVIVLKHTRNRRERRKKHEKVIMFSELLTFGCGNGIQHPFFIGSHFSFKSLLFLNFALDKPKKVKSKIYFRPINFIAYPLSLFVCLFVCLFVSLLPLSLSYFPSLYSSHRLFFNSILLHSTSLFILSYHFALQTSLIHS